MIAWNNDVANKRQRDVPHGVRNGLVHERPTSASDGSASRAAVRCGISSLAQLCPRTTSSRLGRALVRLYVLRDGTAGQSLAETESAARSADGCPERDPERRTFPRRESGCEVAVCLRREKGPLNQQQMAWQLHASSRKGSLVNISMNGVAFLLNEPIEKGEEVLLRLTNRRFPKNVDTRARVSRALSDGNGRWKIICQFQTNLSLEQVHDLGRHLFQSDFV